jgi:saccharopine dehydrogenase-like NADP-dependent oxidoreductase
MKRLLILGVGAQGSTVAKRMNDEPHVSEIICADYDEKAVAEMVKTLDKAKGLKLDASRVEDIIQAAQGVDLVVNALPIVFGRNVLEAALEAGVNYQDFAAGECEDTPYEEGIRLMLTHWNEKFAQADLSALMSTGSAPGLANIITRNATDVLDSCDTIQIHIYEGIWAKRFLPFWWSPEVAFQDMSDTAFCYENGALVKTEPFSRPMLMNFKGVDKTVRTVEHAHDEPVTMGLMADKYLKGAKNIYFKYGGFGVDFAEPLYRMGLLSNEPVQVNGTRIAPMDLIKTLAPPAPKYPSEIKEILDEGLVCEEGAFLVRVEGVKDDHKVRIDNYVNAPGLTEAFETAGLTAETYLTGQCGALFTKMFVNDKIHQKGMFPPEIFEQEQRAYYLREAAKLSITVDQIVEKQLF